jgi:hypothetical protein
LFDFEPEETGNRYPRVRIKAGGMIVMVAVPDDEEAAATYFGARVRPEENRL